jgi:hypothetical protein
MCIRIKSTCPTADRRVFYTGSVSRPVRRSSVHIDVFDGEMRDNQLSQLLISHQRTSHCRVLSQHAENSID